MPQLDLGKVVGGTELIDDADGKTRYKLGVENGLLYIQAVEGE